MKNYRMQVRLTYHVWVDVEAENEHIAKAEATRKAWREMEKQNGCWGEEPQVLDMLEIHGDDK
jgi:hypothetical protein